MRTETALKLDDHLAKSPGLDQGVRDIDLCRRETLLVEEGFELAAVGQCCRLPENHAVMRLAKAGEQRHEREDTGISSATK